MRSSAGNAARREWHWDVFLHVKLADEVLTKRGERCSMSRTECERHAWVEVLQSRRIV